ncbi:YciI family protein [Aminobacter aminovorans]|uniref:YciI family protein n=1 Tax=Aminobacter aminovorans TaxID=83263 RepID=UPI002854BE18|nr:YciI family protein [Aminobacter aminovorans]MDR7224855.1 hypothetical protein [Aminobacter aminovorans]
MREQTDAFHVRGQSQQGLRSRRHAAGGNDLSHGRLSWRTGQGWRAADGSGLQPSSKGWRITWSDGKKTVTDGPFAETKELIAGYTIIQVKTREEAMEWANRFPSPQIENGQIEVRQMFDLEDFEPSEGIERFREMGIAQDRK